jgi:hypothetical protein
MEMVSMLVMDAGSGTEREAPGRMDADFGMDSNVCVDSLVVELSAVVGSLTGRGRTGFVCKTVYL